MPSSAVRTITDPGDYAAAIRATTIAPAAMGHGRFTGKRTRIDRVPRAFMRPTESAL
jgi:hypothetical protein